MNNNFKKRLILLLGYMYVNIASCIGLPYSWGGLSKAGLR